jgi:hypothetical protein
MHVVLMEPSLLVKMVRTLQFASMLMSMVLLQVSMVSLSTLTVISQMDVIPPVKFTTHTAVFTVVQMILQERLVILVTSMLTAVVMPGTIELMMKSLCGVKPMSWEEPSLSRKMKTTLDKDVAHVLRSMDVLVHALDMVSLVPVICDSRRLYLTINYYCCGLEKNLLLIIYLIKIFII